MRKWFDAKAARRRSIKARDRANRRWAKHRAALHELDNKDPIRVGGRIVERLIRVVAESRVIERSFYEFDRPCDWKRKRKEVLGNQEAKEL